MQAWKTIRCGNPSCAGRIHVPPHLPVIEALRLAGWEFPTEDDEDRPFCRRCLR